MNIQNPTQEQFLKDVEQHRMNVLLDSGLYRHLRFSKPDFWDMSFEIVTVPHCLLYRGDMGSFSFSRVPDMFTFFRNEERRINLPYWASKLESTDRVDGHETFDIEYAKNLLIEEYPKQRLWIEELDDSLDESELRRKLYDFEAFLPDAQELDFCPFSFRFVWCCRAIVWAIAQYDKAQNSNK